MRDAERCLRTALSFHQAGELGQAEDLYRQVLEVDPACFDALRLLGILLRAQGKFDLAERFLKRACEIKPTNPDIHNDLGLLWFDLDRPEKAVLALNTAIALKPAFPEAYYNLGNVYFRLKEYGTATSNYLKAVSLDPQLAIAFYNLGLIAQEESKLDEAIEFYSTVLKIEPLHGDAMLNLALCLRDAGQNESSESALRRLLEIQPDHPKAKPALAIVLTIRAGSLVSSGDKQTATALCEEALRLCPNLADAWTNMGLVQHAAEKVDSAIDCFQKAVELQPQSPGAWENLGLICHAGCRFSEAISCFEQAIRLSPENNQYRAALSLVQLLTGRFDEGWANFESRWGTNGLVSRGLEQPRWNGESLDGRRMFVYTEQGYGDTIQFCRFLPELARRGARIILECPEPLKRLLETLDGIETIITSGQTLPPHDVHVPMLSLGGQLGVKLNTIPNTVPYLGVPKACDLVLPPGPPGALRVGIVWAGNPGHKQNANRSIPFDKFRSLLSVPGVAFYSLQVGSEARQLESLVARPHIFDLSSQLSNFAATAASISQLDLIISVDTAVAHLAGALAKPVWLLLQNPPDWRWLMDRDDSPWYPTARLFRQTISGQWESVIERVRTSLIDVVRVADAHHSEAIARNPIPELLQKANKHQENHRPSEAAACFEEILKLQPDFIPAHLELALMDDARGHFESAERHAHLALEIDPNNHVAWGCLSALHLKQNRLKDTIECAQRALDRETNFVPARVSLAYAFFFNGDFKSAQHECEMILKQDPGHVGTLVCLGMIQSRQGNFREALNQFQAALRIAPNDPDALVNLAMCELLVGEMGSGWEHYEARWQTRMTSCHQRTFDVPRWEGQSCRGKTVFVHAEQGFGDTIQFCRYLPLLAARGAKVVFECQPALQDLMKSIAGIQQVIAQGQNLQKYDFEIPLLSLPKVFRTDIETIPADIPYLTPLGGLHPILSESRSHQIKVGIFWCGSRSQNHDTRPVPLEQFGPVLEVTGCTWYSLQVDSAVNDIQRLGFSDTIIDLSPDLRDFNATASVVAQLDLVITIDSAVAHLAGALAKPTWVLISYAPDWRWFLDRNDSPWYPSARLFRQERLGDWSGPIRTVATELERLVADSTSSLNLRLPRVQAGSGSSR